MSSLLRTARRSRILPWLLFALLWGLSAAALSFGAHVAAGFGG
ncbi:MAG: hypothetical protein R3362_12085 [Rhodothermales bacterium]|nr:hypothetical protein [Rhodothermales bacterium]